MSPTPGLEEVLDRICPKICAHCGEILPRPGEDCASCGEIPRLLREDAARQLSEPGALAEKQAEHHRKEAGRLLEALIAEHLAADRVLFTDKLAQAVASAEAELTAALARYDQAEAPLKGLRTAEEQLARDVEDARTARGKFDLEARKAERHNKGTEAIVRARQAVAIADEELAKRTDALIAAQGARAQAEALVAEADREVERLGHVADHAARRLENPPSCSLSPDSLRALGAPVLSLAGELAPLRLNNPGMRFTTADVAGNDVLSFVVGYAASLGHLTGLLASEHAIGVADGKKQAEAEANARPKVFGNTVVPPGSRQVPGGVVTPGWPR